MSIALENIDWHVAAEEIDPVWFSFGSIRSYEQNHPLEKKISIRKTNSIENIIYITPPPTTEIPLIPIENYSETIIWSTSAGAIPRGPGMQCIIRCSRCVLWPFGESIGSLYIIHVA